MANSTKISDINIDQKFGDYYHYSGAIHLHSKYSDGGGTYDDIIKAASSLKLDYIIPTDHNTVKPYTPENEAYKSNVLVVPAVEISTDNQQGHFLVIGDDKPIIPGNGMSSDEIFHDSMTKGMMTFLSHIYHPHPKSDWHNWEIGEFTGMEIFNFDSNFRVGMNRKRAVKLLLAYILSGFRDSAVGHIIQYPHKDLAKFDEISKTRKIVGIGVSDAHSRLKVSKKKQRFIKFPSYKCMMELVNTVIMTKRKFTRDYRHDRSILMDALARGNSYVTFPCHGNAIGFQFTASSDNDTAIMGDSLKMNSSAEISCNIPKCRDITVQILRNGEIFHESHIMGRSKGQTIRQKITEDGVYRIQALQHRAMLPFPGKNTYPLVLTNPIYVKKG